MTETEILDLISKAKFNEPGFDEALDGLLGYMDDIFKKANGGKSNFSLEMLWQTSQFNSHSKDLPEYDLTDLITFLHAFQERDPHLTFWFSWAPYRFYLRKSGEWDRHVKLHNEKVLREFPVERHKGLLVDPLT